MRFNRAMSQSGALVTCLEATFFFYIETRKLMVYAEIRNERSLLFPGGLIISGCLLLFGGVFFSAFGILWEWPLRKQA